MATCDRCGGDIEFRYINGARRPIHTSGGCSSHAGAASASARSSFEKLDSYLDPNARCPVCSAPVYFYRSPNNGRVFFDNVGWPWPKHPCTDRYSGNDADIPSSFRNSVTFHFRGKDGKLRDTFFVRAISERLENETLLVRLARTEGRESAWFVVSIPGMLGQGVTIADLREPPTVVVARDSAETTQIEFMCARLQKIIALRATRANEADFSISAKRNTAD